MSNCKKCDRCGEYYAKAIDNRKLGKLYDNGGTTKNEWDLCPDCWESFDSWIANDGSAPKNDVGDPDGGSNVTWIASSESSFGDVFVDGAQVFPPKALEHVKDSREKLEADVLKHYTHTTSTLMWPDSANIKTKWVSIPMDTVLEWLDRQAAITEREILGAHELSVGCGSCLHKKQADDLRGEWHRVCAERANLARDLGECMADRDRYRALCGQMLDAAHEIRRIADANMPEGAVL